MYDTRSPGTPIPNAPINKSKEPDLPFQCAIIYSRYLCHSINTRSGLDRRQAFDRVRFVGIPLVQVNRLLTSQDCDDISAQAVSTNGVSSMPVLFLTSGDGSLLIARTKGMSYCSLLFQKSGVSSDAVAPPLPLLVLLCGCDTSKRCRILSPIASQSARTKATARIPLMAK